MACSGGCMPSTSTTLVLCTPVRACCRGRQRLRHPASVLAVLNIAGANDGDAAIQVKE